MLIDTKSLLAKLMATENIVVEQKNIPTAMFNVKDRILTVPIFEETISAQKYDLFIGHEVGHALWTPMDGMILGIKEKINSGVLNVVEDSRVERKIKNKYPGLRNSFVKAYNELYEEDFFGTNGVDVNSYNLIDRINLFCKVGVRLSIKFTEQERALLNDVESTETYDDVIEVSKRIIEFMKKDKEEKEKERQKQKEQYGLFEEEEKEGGEDYQESDDYDDENSGDENSETEGATDESEDESEGNKKVKIQSNGSSEKENNSESNVSDMEDNLEENEPLAEEEIRSHTQDSSMENQKNYNSQTSKDYVYANIPKINTKKAIYNYKELYKKHREIIKEFPTILYGPKPELFQNMRKETNKVVSFLVKEFELRKNADQLKRASISKTGDLNLSKIFSYQFSEDIFKKISVVPGGKSHGLVMFLDWSGSMSAHIENTVKQLISLVMFCKKVNIPYEVYAFADSSTYHHYKTDYKMGDMALDNFSLLNLLSSKMTASEFNYAASVLVTISCSPDYAPPPMFRLSSTPLNEAVISAMEIVPEFQKQNKLQMVNTIFLTDGEGHYINKIWDIDIEGSIKLKSISNSRYDNASAVIRDPVTRCEERVKNVFSTAFTSALIKLLKKRTNSNVIGFYVISGREFNKHAYNFYPHGVDIEEIKINFRKNKYAVLTNSGFDEYYILRSENLDTEDDVVFQVKENASTRSLVTAFSKYAGGRISNRVILNRFIGLIT